LLTIRLEPISLLACPFNSAHVISFPGGDLSIHNALEILPAIKLLEDFTKEWYACNYTFGLTVEDSYLMVFTDDIASVIKRWDVLSEVIGNELLVVCSE